MLQKIRHREAQSSCYAKFTSAFRSSNRGGVTKVEVVTVDGDVVAYTEKKDVEREIQKRNPKHFNQPAGTPFIIFPLSEVGVTATQFKTSHLPDGRAVKMPSDTFLETKNLLDLLKAPLPGVAQAKISSQISMTDFTSAIHNWNERTSTPPSGRYLGHYKLLVKTHKDRHAKPALHEAADDILQLVLVDIMDLACNKGFILDLQKARSVPYK
jgi:hypothetical protein